MRATDLIGSRVTRRESGAEIGTCIDLVIDTERGRIERALVDLDGVARGAETLFARARLALVDGRLAVSASDAELAARRDRAEPEDPAGALDLAALPPVVVGPFGYTVAPAMAAAMANDRAGAAQDGGHRRPAIGAEGRAWHWFTALRDAPVFELTTELGRFRDVMIVPEDLGCRFLFTQGEDGGWHVFDFAVIRNVDPKGRAIIVERSETPPYSAEAIEGALRSH